MGRGGSIVEEKYGEGGESPPFPLKDLKDSLRRYVEARRRTSLNSGVLEAEAEGIHKHLVAYAKACREDGATDFSTILEGFYSDVLGLDSSVGNSVVKRSLTRRFGRIARKYIVSDPEKQRTLDDFAP